MEMKVRKCREITSRNVTSYTKKIRAPRILQETNVFSKASKQFITQENLPNGTKDHERK